MTAEIIIPSRDGATLLRRNLPSVRRAAEAIGAGIAVVLDGPDPGAAPLLEGIRTLQLPAPAGYAAAVNAGVETSRAGVVILLNNDMEPETLDGLTAGWRPEEFARTAASLNARQGGLDESPSVWTGEDGLFRVSHPVLGGGEPPPAGAPVAHAHGGASACSREKWMALGGYSELFSPAYGEDVELSFRAWKRGWTVTYCPAARIRHHSAETTGRFYDEKARDRLVECHRLLFHLCALTDIELIRSRDAAFQRIMESTYFDYDRWRLKVPLVGALSRMDAANAHRNRHYRREGLLTDREAFARSGLFL
ncbi:MAG: glycosyltransferase [Deltaproteobacteria bacterium]|nr:glycosyltransferase [Deltaproteobacteria bacterium]